jgi:NADH-quinone oxidoreductase subunit A
MANPLSDFLRSYLTVGIFVGLSALLFGLLLLISWALRPSRPQAGKYVTYESGADPVGNMWSQSQIRYYIFALLFVMFDVEAYGLFGLIEMFIFIFVLLLGLVYAWRKGVLKWA